MQPSTNPYQSFATTDVLQVQKEVIPLSGWIVIGLIVGFIVLAMGAGLLHLVMAGLLGVVMVFTALLRQPKMVRLSCLSKSQTLITVR